MSYVLVQRSDFRLNNVGSSTVSNPPPLASFEKGIPPCVFGYARNKTWLQEYSMKHGLITPQKDDTASEPMGWTAGLHYILDTLGQHTLLTRIEEDETYYLFFCGTNQSEEDLKKTLNSENIEQLKRVLDISNDDSENPMWLVPKNERRCNDLPFLSAPEPRIPPKPTSREIYLSIRRLKAIQARFKGFNPDPYTSSNPPPLYSMQTGIPPCAFGYTRSHHWLREYTLKHQLVNMPPERQKHSDLAGVALQYIFKQIGQDEYLASLVDNGCYDCIFFIGSNRDEGELEKALDPRNIQRLRKALDIADDNPESPRWIRPSA
ncbi:hypothetical protein C8Q75DRAFT_803596 [Abortiporus biennis]|nr:hypothetical protein C8Q75DRAFT_803596 [Abortiporus biennis]